MRWFEPIPEMTKSNLPKHWILFATLLITPVNIIGWTLWAKLKGNPIEEGLRAAFYITLFGLLFLILISKMKFLGSREVSFGKKFLQITNTTPLVKISYDEIQSFSFDQFENINRSLNRLTVSTKDGQKTSVLLPQKISEAEIRKFLTEKTNKA